MALQELAENVEKELETLTSLVEQRHISNPVLLGLLKRAEVPGGGYWSHHGDHERALREAYPPIEGHADPDILAFDYDAVSGPYDWWCEASWLMCKSMRMAHDRGNIETVQMLEPLRERATAQQVQGDADYERRWAKPRRAPRRAEASQ